MEMRSRREPRHADKSDDLSLADESSGADSAGNLRHVRVERRASETVVDLHVMAVAAPLVGDALDDAVGGGVDARPRRGSEIRAVVQEVYDALKEKGYNPINQLVGYILSEDPTYITTYKNARSLIRRVDRDDLLQALVRNYVNP